MGDIAQAFLDAMATVSQNENKNVATTLTIECVIDEVVDKGVGKYKARYLGNPFEVYSCSINTVFSVGDRVYVLVPNGDFSQTKTIIGSAAPSVVHYANAGAASTGVAADVDAAVIREITSNSLITSVNDGQDIELCTYASPQTKIFNATSEADETGSRLVALNFPELFGNYLEHYRTFMLSFKVRTSIPKEQQAGGNYGVTLTIPMKGKGYNEDGEVEEKIWDYNKTVDVHNMIGSPYAFDNWIEQKLIFTFEDGVEYEKLGASGVMPTLTFFCDGFAPNEEKADVNDIFFKDFRFSPVELLTSSKLDGYYLTIEPTEGPYFYDGSYNTKKELIPTLRVNGKLTVLGNKCEYYWFVEDAGVSFSNTYYSKYGGVGWRCLNPRVPTSDSNEEGATGYTLDTAMSKLTISNNDVITSLRYKCVILLDGKELSAITEVENLDNTATSKVDLYADKDVYARGSGLVTLTVDVFKNGITNIENDENDENNYVVCYNWIRYDKDGNCLNSSEDLDFFQLSGGVNTIQEYYNGNIPEEGQEDDAPGIIGDKNGRFYDYLCYNEHYYDKNGIRNLSYFETKIVFPVAEIRETNSVTCTVFAISTKDGNDNRIIIGSKNVLLRTAVIDNYLLQLENADVVYKYDGSGDSPMVANYDGDQMRTIPPITYRLYDDKGIELTESEYEFCHTVWKVPKTDYCMIHVDKNMNELLVGENSEYYDEYYDVYESNGRFGIPYGIANMYSFHKQDNSILLEVKYDNKVLTATANLKFLKEGESGTNGTKYTAIIEYNGYTYGSYDKNKNPQKMHFVHIAEDAVAGDKEGSAWYLVGENILRGVIPPIKEEDQDKSDGQQITNSDYMAIYMKNYIKENPDASQEEIEEYANSEIKIHPNGIVNAYYISTGIYNLQYEGGSITGSIEYIQEIADKSNWGVLVAPAYATNKNITITVSSGEDGDKDPSTGEAGSEDTSKTITVTPDYEYKYLKECDDYVQQFNKGEIDRTTMYNAIRASALEVNEKIDAIVKEKKIMSNKNLIPLKDLKEQSEYYGYCLEVVPYVNGERMTNPNDYEVKWSMVDPDITNPCFDIVPSETNPKTAYIKLRNVISEELTDYSRVEFSSKKDFPSGEEVLGLVKNSDGTPKPDYSKTIFVDRSTGKSYYYKGRYIEILDHNYFKSDDFRFCNMVKAEVHIKGNSNNVSTPSDKDNVTNTVDTYINCYYPIEITYISTRMKWNARNIVDNLLSGINAEDKAAFLSQAEEFDGEDFTAENIPTLDGGFYKVLYSKSGTAPQYDKTQDFFANDVVYDYDKDNLFDYEWRTSDNDHSKEAQYNYTNLIIDDKAYLEPGKENWCKITPTNNAKIDQTKNYVRSIMKRSKEIEDALKTAIEFINGESESISVNENNIQTIQAQSEALKELSKLYKIKEWNEAVGSSNSFMTLRNSCNVKLENARVALKELYDTIENAEKKKKTTIVGFLDCDGKKTHYDYFRPIFLNMAECANALYGLSSKLSSSQLESIVEKHTLEKLPEIKKIAYKFSGQYSDIPSAESYNTHIEPVVCNNIKSTLSEPSIVRLEVEYNDIYLIVFGNKGKMKFVTQKHFTEDKETQKLFEHEIIEGTIEQVQKRLNDLIKRIVIPNTVKVLSPNYVESLVYNSLGNKVVKAVKEVYTGQIYNSMVKYDKAVEIFNNELAKIVEQSKFAVSFDDMKKEFAEFAKSEYWDELIEQSKKNNLLPNYNSIHQNVLDINQKLTTYKIKEMIDESDIQAGIDAADDGDKTMNATKIENQSSAVQIRNWLKTVEDIIGNYIATSNAMSDKVEESQKSILDSKHYKDNLYAAIAAVEAITGSAGTGGDTEKGLNIQHIKPIIMLSNAYENEAMNNWDGTKMYIDENGQYMYAPQFGAGIKDKFNRFTGFYMGITSDPTKDKVKEQSEEIGLMGMSHGVQSVFISAESGCAVFGTPNAGQIVIDPNSKRDTILNGKTGKFEPNVSELPFAGLYSSSFWRDRNFRGIPKNYTRNNETGEGLLIDLTTPEIRFGSGTFSVDKDGIMTATAGNIGSWGIYGSKLYASSKVQVKLDGKVESWRYHGIFMGTPPEKTEDGKEIVYTPEDARDQSGKPNPYPAIYGGWSDSSETGVGRHNKLRSIAPGFYLGTDGLSFGDVFRIVAADEAQEGMGNVLLMGKLSVDSDNKGEKGKWWTVSGINNNSYISYNANHLLTLGGPSQDHSVFISTAGISLGNRFLADDQGNLRIGDITGERGLNGTHWIISSVGNRTYISSSEKVNVFQQVFEDIKETKKTTDKGIRYTELTYKYNKSDSTLYPDKSVYLGTDGITLGRNFSINNKGEIQIFKGELFMTKEPSNPNNGYLRIQSNGTMSGGSPYIDKDPSKLNNFGDAAVMKGTWKIKPSGEATFPNMTVTDILRVYDADRDEQSIKDDERGFFITPGVFYSGPRRPSKNEADAETCNYALRLDMRAKTAKARYDEMKKVFHVKDDTKNFYKDIKDKYGNDSKWFEYTFSNLSNVHSSFWCNCDYIMLNGEVHGTISKAKEADVAKAISGYSIVPKPYKNETIYVLVPNTNA